VPQDRSVSQLGIVLASIAVTMIAIAWTVSSLGDANQTSLGHWLDQHSAGIWGFLIGAVPTIAAYFFGSARAKKAAKHEAFTSAVSTVRAGGNATLAGQLVTEVRPTG
jgi:hypothetical protein